MAMENQSFMTSIYVHCEILNASMMVDYSIINSNNSTVYSGSQSWNGTNSSSSNFTSSVPGLPAEYYIFHADLYVDGTLVDSDYDWFNVYANSSSGGGNNTGGNQTSPCGSNVNYTSVYAYGPYAVMENQSFMTSTYVHCEIINATMVLDYSITNSNNSTVYSGNQSWTGTNSSSSNYTWNLNGLSAGSYAFYAYLYVDGTLVDSDYDWFNVYANSSGGGGNNTGGNNTGGNNTGGNNTGGNNTGGNNTNGNDAHCLTIDNISMTPTYMLSFDLVNICSIQMNYPGVNASADHAGVSGLPSTHSWWFYAIGPNGSYNFSFQLSFDENVSNNTVVNLIISPTILNCGGNNSWHHCPDSSGNYTFTYVQLSNNTGGNNTGGNNTGGNNTDGNNTGGNNTGGNNTGGETSGNNTGGNNTGGETSGNNTDGNNTGGNNTGGNNTGGNNTGGNSTVDTDYDGVIDNLDNCPLIGNPSQTDYDEDGIGDGCDSDIDGDGMTNENDAFPNDPSEQSDIDGDGVGDNTDADDDGDGIADGSDNCPFVANSDQADLDGNGIGTACDSLEITVDENGTIEVDGDSIPALSMFGTIAAISVGLLIAIRREDEE